IRNFRIVSPERLQPLMRWVHDTLDAVVSQPRPAGIEHFEPDPRMLFLLAMGTVNPAFIRRCPICAQFFYAQRKDQIACSRSCANAERQRRFRKRRSVYEANRKRNLAARKAREELRKSGKLR